ncbi:type II toxin-antitoxin system Phd/YefM family antitoxin [Kitasatospora sp. LaBMicrA B282]|uniref:type II toxin-antitoxin system Phd/YefM family antitoxin n=1 Tax=Kitasatospora sp. LaBMicrA B282 TaxID=3420949 RepID=UPI003D12BA4B
MKRMSLAKAKEQFSALVEEVVTTHEQVMVTRNGESAVIVLAVEEYASLMETIEILRDPETMRRLAESDAEIARGEEIGQEELAAAMADRLH